MLAQTTPPNKASDGQTTLILPQFNTEWTDWRNKGKRGQSAWVWDQTLLCTAAISKLGRLRKFELFRWFMYEYCYR